MEEERESSITVPLRCHYYKPLDLASLQIRLLVVWPKEHWNNGVPKCSLIRVSLADSHPIYSALSYCWGSAGAGPPKHIMLAQIDELQLNRYLWSDQEVGEYGELHQLLLSLKLGTASHEVYRHMEQRRRLKQWFEARPKTTRTDYQIDIQTPVWDFLNKMSPSSGPSLLFWIDALCINQADSIERSSQILRMKEIYGRAFNVPTWLGIPASPEESKILHDLDAFSEVLKALDRIAKQCPVSRITVDEALEEWDKKTRLPGLPLKKQLLELFLTEKPITDEIKQVYCRLSGIFTNPWFRRMWVLQEIRNNKRRNILYGQHGCLWDSLVFGQRLLTRINKDIVRPDAFVKHRKQLLAQFVQGTKASAQSWDERLNACVFTANSYLPKIWEQIWAGHKPIPFLSLMCQTREFGASDPRDKVLSLLGIAAETENLKVLPEELGDVYSKTVEQLYIDFTSWLIDHEKSLNIWYFIDHHHNSQKSTKARDMPSWVPDFSGEISPAGMTIGYQQLYNACNSIPVICRTHSQTNILQIEGAQVATVGHFLVKNFSRPNLWNDVYHGHIDDNSYRHELSNSSDILPSLADGLRRARKRGFPMMSLFQTLTCCIRSNNVADTERFFQTERVDFPIADLYDNFCRFQAKDYPNNFSTYAAVSCTRRSLFLTADEATTGLCSDLAQTGDLVVILSGGNVPFILREIPQNRRPEKPADRKIYKLVGECYLYGYMDGRGYRNARRREFAVC